MKTSDRVGQVKFFNEKEGYGFVVVSIGHGEHLDVHVNTHTLQASGFCPEDMKPGLPVFFDFKGELKRKSKVVKIHRVGSKDSPADFHRKQVDRQGDLYIFEATHNKFGISRYEVWEGGLDGKMKETIPTSLADAREMIGKVLNSPQSKDHGVKTNVGGLNHVKGPSSGGKNQNQGKKNKAA